MATPLSDGSIVQVNVLYTDNGQRLMNVLHYKYDNAGGAPDYQDAMTELLTLFSAAGDLKDDIIDILPSTAVLNAIEAQPVYPQRLTRITTTFNLTGNRTGTKAPQNVAGVVTKRTVLATRYGRGSWHQAGLLAADITNGLITSAFALLLDEIGFDIVTDRELATLGFMHPVLWSPKVPGRSTPISSYRLQDSVRTMRRRTVGVGK